MVAQSPATMQEKDFQTTFNHWIAGRSHESAAFELKLTKEKSLPFSRLEEHQKRALYLAKHQEIIFKIPDAGYQNPFDSFLLKGVKAYVVVMFYERGQKEFFMIDIDDWINEEKTSKRKSLTPERAREIGRVCHLIRLPSAV